MNPVAARRQMVDQQIRTWEVLDPVVLDVLANVPREAFVPAEYRDLAFADAPLPIGFGEMMLAPKLHGRILQALGIKRSDSVLEIGTGTGYLCACMSLLAGETTSIDIRGEFVAMAKINIRAVAEAKPRIETRDAFGAEPLGQFDAIAVTASLPVYDTRFERALTIGGRLFVVVGVPPVMEAMLVRRVDASEWVREALFETVIQPLVGAVPAARFVF
jgi:protein-L-isoaspartate(D-aspartate) O-methyltransferase